MNDFTLPETRYALSGDVNIAYQTMCTGPVDIIMVPGFVSHVELRTSWLDIRHSCAGFRHLPASSHLTKEARDCPTE
jgi:hypothetical protein